MSNEKILLLIIVLGVLAMVLAFSLVFTKLLSIIKLLSSNLETQKDERYISSIEDLSGDEIESLKFLFSNIGIHSQKTSNLCIQDEDDNLSKLAEDLAEDILSIKTSKDIVFKNNKEAKQKVNQETDKKSDKKLDQNSETETTIKDISKNDVDDIEKAS